MPHGLINFKLKLTKLISGLLSVIVLQIYDDDDNDCLLSNYTAHLRLFCS